MSNKKFVIMYNPLVGATCTDGEITNTAANIIDLGNRYLNGLSLIPDYIVGNQMLVDAIRLKIAEGCIPYDRVVFSYQGEELAVTSTGQYVGRIMADGYCDVHQRILAGLVSKRRPWLEGI